MLLLPSRPDDGRNPVVAVGGLALLILHLLRQLGRWCQAVDDLNAEHCGDVLVLERLELARINTPRLPSVAQHSLGVGVAGPI